MGLWDSLETVYECGKLVAKIFPPNNLGLEAAIDCNLQHQLLTNFTWYSCLLSCKGILNAFIDIIQLFIYHSKEINLLPQSPISCSTSQVVIVVFLVFRLIDSYYLSVLDIMINTKSNSRNMSLLIWHKAEKFVITNLRFSLIISYFNMLFVCCKRRFSQ